MIGLIFFLMFGSSNPVFANQQFCTCGMSQGFIDPITKKCVPKVVPGKCASGQFYCSGPFSTYQDGLEYPLCVASTECGTQMRTCRKAFEAKLAERGKNDNFARYWADNAKTSLLASGSSVRHDPKNEGKTWNKYCKSNQSDPDCQEREELDRTVNTYQPPPAAFAQRQDQLRSQAFSAEYDPPGTVNQNQQFTPKGNPIGTPDQAIPASGGGGDLWNCLNRVSYLDPISCVACGLEKAVGAQGVDRYVGLLGVMAQSYLGTKNLTKGDGIQDLQLEVIGMIADYGYCTNSEFGGGSSVDTSHQKAISAGINRKKDGFASSIGIGRKFDKTHALKAVGLPTDKKSESRIKTMFRRDRMPTGLQQIRFAEQAAQLKKSNGNSPASACFSSMEKRSRGANAWNICERECDPKKPGQKTQRCGRKFKPERMDQRNSLYMQIASTCGIQVTDPYGYSGCRKPKYIPNGGDKNDRPDNNDDKGSEPTGDRPDSGGPSDKGGEDSSDRSGGPSDSGKGSESESSRSNSGGGGKGGEASGVR